MFLIVPVVFWPSLAFRETFGEGAAQSLGDETAEKEAVRAQLLELREETPPDCRDALDRALALLDGLQDRDVQDAFVADVLSVLEGSDPAPRERHFGWSLMVYVLVV